MAQNAPEFACPMCTFLWLKPTLSLKWPCLQELADTAGLGHNNKKQKLQHYLRLKLHVHCATVCAQAHPTLT